jgi:hypothetical protein
VTPLLIAAVVSFAVQAALQSPAVWWFMAAARPCLVVVVAATPRFGPFGVAWFGLALGIAADVIDDRIIGPGGIAGAAAGLAVSVVVGRFELQGPLYWIGGAALASIVSDLTYRGVALTLSIPSSWGWIGSLATVVTTAIVALAVAAADSVRRTLTSPERRRRRVLKRL